jgi:hypothetical protein
MAHGGPTTLADHQAHQSLAHGHSGHRGTDTSAQGGGGGEGEPVMMLPRAREAAGMSSNGEGQRWLETLGEEGAPRHGMSL